MIPYQTFNCPHCGAPGQVNYGQAEYSCTCRLTRQVYTPADAWPKCPHCGQPIYAGHSFVAVTCATQGKADEQS